MRSAKKSRKLIGTSINTGKCSTIIFLSKPKRKGNVFQTKKKYQKIMIKFKISYKPVQMIAAVDPNSVLLTVLLG